MTKGEKLSSKKYRTIDSMNFPFSQPGATASKLYNKIIPQRVDDYLLKDECKQNMVLTYDYIPEITLLALEQYVYFMIFALFLFEIYAICRFLLAGNNFMKYLKDPIFLMEFTALIFVTCIFFTFSFRIIPLMVQSCKQTYKIFLVRFLNLFIIAFFYGQLYIVLKENFDAFVSRKLEAGKKIVARYMGEDYEIEREELINKMYAVNYKKYLCDGNKPIEGLDEFLTEEGYTKVEEACKTDSNPSWLRSIFGAK